ncbi:hypothetical protein Tco_1046540, partial [Tanacetum coccineum]
NKAVGIESTLSLGGIGCLTRDSKTLRRRRVFSNDYSLYKCYSTNSSEDRSEDNNTLSVSEDDLYMGSPGVEDSKDSTVTYTEIPSPYKDPSDLGSPRVEGPIFQDPPSPDYMPGLEEPELAPPSPIYVPFVPEPVYLEFLPVEDEVFPVEEQPMPTADSPTHQSPGYIPESDPKENPEEDDEEDLEEDPAISYFLDPADYPTDKGDDDDDDDTEEEEHLAPADPVAVAYSADQDPYLAYRVTARRDALPSPVHETKMPEICLPLHKRLCRTTLGPRYEVGESSAAGAVRQVRPTTAKVDLYGFADMLDATPGCQTSRKLSYGITDTWDDLVGAIQEITPTTLEGVNQRVIELATTVDQEDEIIYSQLDDARRQTVISDMLKADYRRQRQLVEAVKIVKNLKTQMIELQRQQGPAKDPADPELPEEASSSS